MSYRFKPATVSNFRNYFSIMQPLDITVSNFYTTQRANATIPKLFYCFNRNQNFNLYIWIIYHFTYHPTSLIFHNNELHHFAQ
ncbi:hypothetical protein Hanom_Chr17g01582631 [Helianthus anomalus]